MKRAPQDLRIFSAGDAALLVELPASIDPVTSELVIALARAVRKRCAGKLRDVKNYLFLFCYFLQPTPQNIRMMLLFALKHYGSDPGLKAIEIEPPETMPSVAIYHPDAPALFESFADYQKWYVGRRQKEKGKRQNAEGGRSFF